MNIQVNRLQDQHNRLDDETTAIEKELMQWPFDEGTMKKLSELKKKKLIVKDKLQQLKGE
jgi:uncharacterized protein YdcH (DUF465 family)